MAAGILALAGLCLVALPGLATEDGQFNPQPRPQRLLVELRLAVQGVFTGAGVIGAAYAIVEDGSITALETLGHENIDKARPITTTTLFRVGSISKNVTSLMALALVEKDILDLEIPIGDVLPEAAAKNGWSGPKPVRLDQLLEHTSGLPGSSYAEYGADMGEMSPTEYVQAMYGRLRPRWMPGAYYSYANSGHTIAAAAMERITGLPFDRLVSEEVFKPLGMTSATFRWQDEDMRAAVSQSYDQSRQPAGHWHIPMRPSGSMMASIADMTRLAQFYATGGGAPSTRRIASPPLLKRMRVGRTSIHARNGYRLSYGFGTFSFLAGGHFFSGHWGKTDGFLANLGYLPDQRSAFVLLSNTSDRRAMGKARELIASYLVRNMSPRIAPPEIPVHQLDQLTGWYHAVTDDMTMWAWVSRLLSTTRIVKSGDALVAQSITAPYTGQAFIATGPNSFRLPEENFISTVFTRNAKGKMTFINSGQDTFLAISPLAGWAIVTFVLLAGSEHLPLTGIDCYSCHQAGPRHPYGGWRPCYAVRFVGGHADGIPLDVLRAWTSRQHFRYRQTWPHQQRLIRIDVAESRLAGPALFAVAQLLRRWQALHVASRVLLGLAMLVFGCAAGFLATMGWLPLMTWRG